LYCQSRCAPTPNLPHAFTIKVHFITVLFCYWKVETGAVMLLS
jgi:hypothetical protein